jgi:hypothetical protein
VADDPELVGVDHAAVLRDIERRLFSASAGRRGGRGGIMQSPDYGVLALLLDAGAAGMTNAALCERTGRSEAWMAIMLKHAAEVGLVERSVHRAERAAHRLTDLGREWVIAKFELDRARLRELDPAPVDDIDEIIDSDAVEIRELPPP